MNQRESSGLPLRAMVMVLLFLGVAFALVGWQATRGGDDDSGSESSSVTTVTATSTTTESKTPAPAAKADVRVYNTSGIEGAAAGVADRLREAQWNVTEVGNLVLEGLSATTVYYGETPGEQAAAEEVGKVVAAPVQPRLPALAEQPPGVIVAVTG